MIKFLKSKIRQEREESARKSIISGIKVNSSLLSVVILALIILTGSFYLIQVNKVATKGWQIKDFEQQIKEMKDKNRKIETEIVKLKSTAELEKRVKELGMVNVTNISYYVNNSGAVASAR